jgi:flavodoxin
LPLCTHEGSGLGSTEKEIATVCPQATVSEGLAVRGGKAADAQSDVEEWLKK